MTRPDWELEKIAWKKGFRLVAGIDEVGRGSFAGAVVAGCAIFSNKQMSKYVDEQIKINDSKKLSAKQREIADVWIRGNAVAFGIGEASVAQINKFGIKKATEIAFRKAISSTVKQLNGSFVDFLLVDAFYIPHIKGLRRKNQLAIIKGDTKSISIAAASIIAKVYRDKLMVKLSKHAKHKRYNWDKNKGYGTLEHRNAIKKYGITLKHRKQFVESSLKKA